MGDQCANIAKLVRLSGDEAPKDKKILDTINGMGLLARSQASPRKRHRERLASRAIQAVACALRQWQAVDRAMPRWWSAKRAGDSLDGSI